jgi:phospholipid/cholesterol/gamma-HCH transport system substrate-binding protein
VCLSGVSVGEVKDLHILYGDETLVEVTLWFQDGTQLRTDSLAYVTTLGLMGEKYIEIKAGTMAAPLAKEGDEIPGKDPVRLEELIEMGTKVANDIGKMAQDISHLSKTIDGTVAENRPKLGRIFDNLEDTSENFRDFSEDVKWHPWKVLAKGKEKSQDEILKAREARRAAREQQKLEAAKTAAPVPA